jgi:hypothetical protein
MARYVNPHLECYIRADSIVEVTEPPQQPPEQSVLQELRRKHNLGLYTVEELEDLLGEIADVIVEWVENHPPHDE